jgi:hypothetical protein
MLLVPKGGCALIHPAFPVFQLPGSILYVHSPTVLLSAASTRPTPRHHYTRVIGDALRSRIGGRQTTEVAIAVVSLNRILELGRRSAFASHRCRCGRLTAPGRRCVLTRARGPTSSKRRQRTTRRHHSATRGRAP